MTDRVIRIVCAVAMTIAVLCFAGLTLVLVVAPPRGGGMGQGAGVLLMLFLTGLSAVIAVRLWKPKGRRSVIPVWTIQVFGVFMFCTGVVMVSTRKSSLILDAVLAIPVGLALVVAAPRLLPEKYQAGHCPKCGYDLRGNPMAILCPECGEPISLSNNTHDG